MCVCVCVCEREREKNTIDSHILSRKGFVAENMFDFHNLQTRKKMPLQAIGNAMKIFLTQNEISHRFRNYLHHEALSSLLGMPHLHLGHPISTWNTPSLLGMPHLYLGHPISTWDAPSLLGTSQLYLDTPTQETLSAFPQY